MADAVAVFNAGSSSIRFALYGAGAPTGDPVLVWRGRSEGVGHKRRFTVADAAGRPLVAESAEDRGREFDHVEALARIIGWLESSGAGRGLLAAGHRVVHGGRRHVAPVLVTQEVLAELETLVPLALLHQPHNLGTIRALAAARPDLPQVACFDTAFHRAQPPLARLVPLPAALREQGIERYGFHGLSYEHVAGELPQLLGETAGGRVVVAHLGNGASLCALAAGRSVATTMGFSTLDGLAMGTRCGSLDPGVLLYLLRGGMPLAELEDLLYHRSGLLGLSGVSHDMRELLANDDPRAALAVDFFVYRTAREVGSLAAALGGLDALVFTAGIGEHAPAIRARVCAACRWLGVEIDAAANARGGPRITAAASPVSAWVVATDEEVTIARATLKLLRRD
ncbi:MAG TPA: acetate/propionate family kinase [Candidatus Methanoperedens sp.]|nr:acetate/propionate family kinase [Candidatus Methanoperedens sp.]